MQFNTMQASFMLRHLRKISHTPELIKQINRHKKLHTYYAKKLLVALFEAKKKQKMQ